MTLIDSATFAGLFVLLARRRGERDWGEVLDVLRLLAPEWLPGPWWVYIILIPIAFILLRVLIGAVVRFITSLFRDG